MTNSPAPGTNRCRSEWSSSSTFCPPPATCGNRQGCGRAGSTCSGYQFELLRAKLLLELAAPVEAVQQLWVVCAVLHELVEHPGADCRRYPLPRVDAGVYPHGGLVAAPALAHRHT